MEDKDGFEKEIKKVWLCKVNLNKKSNDDDFGHGR